MSNGVIQATGLPEWDRLPLWVAAPRSKKSGLPDGIPLSVFLEAGVVPRSSREDNHNVLGEDLSRYLIVQPGDIVFNKLRTWQGGLGVSKYHGIVSPAYYVCRSISAIEPRFLHYLLRSKMYLTELTRISKWMPPSQFDTPWDMLRKLPILVPPLEEQRRIADFLDAETSRIARMEACQRQVLDTLDERDQAMLDQVIDSMTATYGTLPLRRSILRVEQGSSPLCDNIPAGAEEWGVLKVSAVKGGRFVPEENKRLPGGVAPGIRYEVHQGDVLITRANTPALVGAMAVVDQTPMRRLLCDKIFRITPDSSLDKQFIVLVSKGRRIRDLCEAASHGTSQSMANLKIEEIKEWPIPAVSISSQVDFVARISNAHEATDRLRRRISRQLALLAERRQALITAAVTGQLDVTTARSGVRP